jgi:4-amino-4-deoxy-L-arabinose transferase-like glycosyltransferase
MDGVPWQVQPLLGIGTLELVFALGRRLYGRHVAVPALVLGVLSPFHSFMIGTYLSHMPATFVITLAYYLLVRSGWGALGHRELGALGPRPGFPRG